MRADEKSSYPIQFCTYMRRHGTDSEPLAQLQDDLTSAAAADK